jgi:hypothetical protein
MRTTDSAERIRFLNHARSQSSKTETPAESGTDPSKKTTEEKLKQSPTTEDKLINTPTKLDMLINPYGRIVDQTERNPEGATGPVVYQGELPEQCADSSGREVDPDAKPVPSPIRENLIERIDDIDVERKAELDDVTDQLIIDHATTEEVWRRRGDGKFVFRTVLELGHDDVANILQEIDCSDISEDEKLYIYHQLAHGKEVPNALDRFLMTEPPSGRSITLDSGEEATYAITTEGADPAVVNSDINGEGNTSSHTVVHVFDNYHVPKADLTPEEAAAEIQDKESNLKSKLLRFGTINNGDVTASERSVALYREYAETGDFTVFAERWADFFVGPSQESPPDVAGSTTTTTIPEPAEGPPQTTTPSGPSEQPPAVTTTTTIPEPSDSSGPGSSPTTTVPGS